MGRSRLRGGGGLVVGRGGAVGSVVAGLAGAAVVSVLALGDATGAAILAALPGVYGDVPGALPEGCLATC